MANYAVAAITKLTKIAQGNLLMSMTRPAIAFSQTRNRHTKHWDPKWKKWRAAKVIKIKLPNFHEDDDDEMTPEKARSKMKEKGLKPSRPWMERPVFVSCTGNIFEPYVPPEGDGKFSAISTAGAKQKVEFMTKKGKSYLAVKKIRRFEEEFSVGDFEETAQEIYVKAHEAVAKKDKEELRLLVTERAYPEVMHNTLDKTMRWKFVESLQLPRVVHARCTDVVSKDNVFAQITVRFHTQQILAVYDRFGRLMHGSEILKKDVLEYVVFEKHLANEYGIWRIHAKIIPEWMPPREYGERTYIEEAKKPQPIEEKQATDIAQVENIPVDTKSTQPTVVA